MLGLRIDFDTFAKHHYWFGWFFWNECKEHKFYNFCCSKCKEGEWNYITNSMRADQHRTYKRYEWKFLRVYKMPMNNVNHKDNDDDQN